jgi:hypothetical protein
MRLHDIETQWPPVNPLERAFAQGAGVGGPASAGSIYARFGDVGAQAQVAVGQNIFQIQNAQFSMSPELGLSLAQQQKQIAIDRALREALEDVLARQPVVLFFDSCEEAPRDVLDWLQRQVLDPVIEGEMAHRGQLSLVVAGTPEGRRGAWVKEVAGWSFGLIAHELANLLPEDVRHYWLTVRSLGEETLPAAFLHAGAPPKLMFEMAQLSSYARGAPRG